MSAPRPRRPRGTRCTVNHPGRPSLWIKRTETRLRFFKTEGVRREVTYSYVYCGTCAAAREGRLGIPAQPRKRVATLQPVPRFGDHSGCDLDGMLCPECSAIWSAVIATGPESFT
jgi:hypothetical protein